MKRLIQHGTGYDETRWADGIQYEKNSAYFGELMRVTPLSDGSLIVPIWFFRTDESGQLIKWPDRFGDVIWPIVASATFRGTWREDGSDLDWDMSNHVTIEQHLARCLEEPSVAEMDEGALMMVMRAGTSALQTMPSVPFFCVSRDGGKTWGPAVPLTYPDGGFVYAPGSYANFFRSSKNGRVYLIANILPKPTRGADPRYPLKIVEIDQKYFWPLRDTETVIADREDRHPQYVRFSNWQRIEDQETGNPVLYMTEDKIDKLFDPYFPGGQIIPDAYRYEIVLPE
jgi:hypothetical protein